MRLCTAFSTIKLGKDSRYVVLHWSTLCNHPSLKCTKNQAWNIVMKTWSRGSTSLYKGQKISTTMGFHHYCDRLEIWVRLHQHPEDHQCPQNRRGAYLRGSSLGRLSKKITMTMIKKETPRAHLGDTYNQRLQLQNIECTESGHLNYFLPLCLIFYAFRYIYSILKRRISNSCMKRYYLNLGGYLLEATKWIQRLSFIVKPIDLFDWL